MDNVQKFSLDSGYEFEAYIPNNVNENTKIILYEHGDNGYTSNWKDFDNQFQNGNCNAIVIHADRKYSTDLASHIANTYNIDISNTIPVGYSGGGVYSCYSAGDIAAKSSSKGNMAVLLEGSCPTPYLNSKGYVEQYKNNDTVFLYFESKSGYGQTNYARELGKKGVNVLVIKDTNSAGHSAIMDNYPVSGLLEYTIGEGELPEGYIIDAYIDGELIENIDASKIKDLSSLYNYFGVDGKVVVEKTYTLAELSQLEDLVLKSDDKELEKYLNGIRRAIRNSGVVKSGYAAGGFSSTTMMPSQVPSVVSRYFEATTSFLSKLAVETDQFAKIADSVNEMNFNLEREAVEIDEIDITKSVYGALSNDIKEDDKVLEESVTEEVVNTSTNKNVEVLQSNNELTTNDNDTKMEQVIPGNVGNAVQEVIGNSGVLSMNSFQTGVLSTDVKNNNLSRVKELIHKFKDYNEVVSDNDRIVYESDEGYKIIIYKNGDDIVALEHLFDFGSEEVALEYLDEIKATYAADDCLKEIIQDGQYIKVILKEEVYNNYDLETLENVYSKSEEFSLK